MTGWEHRGFCQASENESALPLAQVGLRRAVANGVAKLVSPINGKALLMKPLHEVLLTGPSDV